MSLHVGINLCPYAGGFGGADTYLRNLVYALARIGCGKRVSLFVPHGTEGRLSSTTGFQEIACGVAGQSRPRRVFLEQTVLPKLIDRHGIDLIYSNYVSPVRARCRQIVNVHDMLYKVLPGYISSRAKLWYWRTMVPRSVRRAETVLTVSRYSANDIRRFFVADAHKVVVVDQAVAYELADMNSPDLDAGLVAGMGVVEPFALCTTGLDRHKNIPCLLRAFESVARHHHDVRLVLTDPYDRRDLQALRGLSAEVKRRIILSGCVPYRQLAALYRRAVAHVAPSRFEGFGRSVIEAQHFGCPNVVSLGGSLPEVAGDGALYFHPDDSETLATHLDGLLGDHRRRDDITARGYCNVQRFNWEVAARQFLELCDRRSTQVGPTKVAAKTDPRRNQRGDMRMSQRWSKNGRVRKLPVVVLMPHSRCNCRCIMCDIWRGNAAYSEFTLEKIVDWRALFRRLAVRRVMLTGGEPLMHGDIERLLRLLHEWKLQTTVASSGLLLRRYARAIVECCADVVVSLDGSRSIHDAIRRVPGAFDRLADGIKALHDSDPSFRVTGRCTIQRGNFRDWPNIVDAARAIGLDSISFQAVDVSSAAFNRPRGWEPAQVETVAVSRSELPELIDVVETLIRRRTADIRSGFIAESPEKLRRIAAHFSALCGEGDHVSPRCNAPWMSAVIEADGEVRPCFFHRSFGNVNDSSLTDILNSTEMVGFRRALSVTEDPICRRCVCSLHASSKWFSQNVCGKGSG